MNSFSCLFSVFEAGPRHILGECFVVLLQYITVRFGLIDYLQAILNLYKFKKGLYDYSIKCR